MLTYTLFGRSIEFFIGMALAYYLRQAEPAHHSGYRFTALGLLAIFMLVSVAAFANVAPASKLIIHQYILPFATAFFMYGLIREKTMLHQLLSSRAFEVLGRSSYALYLIHIGFIPTLTERYVSSNTLIVTTVVLICSVILWKWVEEPLQKVVLRFAKS
jgi:peptidoglycan/LPS O-acetylase OafA/YrhL